MIMEKIILACISLDIVGFFFPFHGQKFRGIGWLLDIQMYQIEEKVIFFSKTLESYASLY